MHVIVHFGFPENTASDYLFILCLLYAGESQSISEAKKQRAANTTVPNWTSGSPCRGRFNTERTVT